MKIYDEGGNVIGDDDEMCECGHYRSQHNGSAHIFNCVLFTCSCTKFRKKV